MHRAGVCRAAAVIGLCLIGGRSASAQTPEELKHMSLDDLTRIEVTSVGKAPEAVWDTPAAVYVITQEDIRRSGATSIPEILRLAPGVNVSRIDSDHWAIGIRGFANQFSKSVLVLIDGRSVYTPLFAGVYWQVQDTLIEDIDRIEVIRGPGGTVWGSNAVNGVINIITQSARDTTGALVSALGGSVDHGIGEARVGGASDRFAYRVYGKGFARGPEDHPAGVEYDDWHGGQAGFRTEWTHAADSVTFQGDAYRSVDGSQVQIASFSPPSAPIVDGNIVFTGANLLARWKRDIRPDSGFSLQVYWDHTSQSGPQAQDTLDTFDVDYVQRTPWRRNRFVYGAGARISPDRFTQVVPTTSFVPADRTLTLYSAFLQDQVALAPAVGLTVGSKFEHNVYTGLEVEPTVRVLWTPSGRQSAWAAVTRAIRSPARLDRDLDLFLLARGTPPIVYAQVEGNSSFESETLAGYELGYRALVRSRLSLDIAGFHNRYDGLVGLGNATLASVQGPGVPHLVGTLLWTNAVDGATDGFEITPDWRPVSWWQLRGAYSYLHMDLHTRAGLTDLSSQQTFLGSSPHHQISVSSRLTLKAIEFDQTYRHVSELPAQLVPAYDTADVRVGWRRQGFDLSVVGQNLFDASHPEFGMMPSASVGIRRAFYARITWTR
ncbi:MAG TPA: TonB-dependent receptor plug domain-containing protein [Vicinamibacterales bacterium]|nr:TonB-dependent receptor plug domain-containing protein [Vicinamibacterales bacterium]